jgi:hypothetical protein
MQHYFILFQSLQNIEKDKKIKDTPKRGWEIYFLFMAAQ